MSITLPAEMASDLRRTVDGGQYASTSEVIREAVREWTRNRDENRRDLDALREAVRLGDESGPGIPADEVFADLRQTIAKRRAKPPNRRTPGEVFGKGRHQPRPNIGRSWPISVAVPRAAG